MKEGDKSYKGVLTMNACSIAIKCGKFGGHFSTTITSEKDGQLLGLFAGFIEFLPQYPNARWKTRVSS